jgi:ATP adenylyltransferase
MERLWAPWRAGYITGTGKVKKDRCLFCAIRRAGNDKKNLVFARSAHSFAVLNLYPYNNGHSLVLPNRHVADLDRLSGDEHADLWALFSRVKILLTGVLKPDGFNVGINLGKVAGAGVPGHVHIHLVPRWKGDVNFMPVVNGTRVISQSLAELYRSLAAAEKSGTSGQTKKARTGGASRNGMS